MRFINAIIISLSPALYQEQAIKNCKQVANGVNITLSAINIAKESELNSLMFHYIKSGG